MFTKKHMEIFVLLRATQNVKIGHGHKSWVAKEIDKFKNKHCPGIVMYKTRNSYGQLYRNT